MMSKYGYNSTKKTRLLQRLIAALLLISTAIYLSGCQSKPPEQNFAAEFSANLQYLKGNPYVHAVYVNGKAFDIQTERQSAKRFLHVYIEGDGSAFVDGKVSLNPTPKNPLMLKLMQEDQHPAIYLGRPCYFNPKDDQCSPNVWTRHRYSRKVLNSMSAALDHFSSSYDHLVFIGHSGGGALAALLASEHPKAAMLVTLAGNLDTFAWAIEHQYQPLKESLNPMELDPLAKHILQIHYAGTEDDVILPDWIEAFAEKQQRAEFHQLPSVDHAEGWEAYWPQILEKLTQYQEFVETP